MLIHRMKKLNPSKLGLMIVDRIPLVDQHKKTIENETGLILVYLQCKTFTVLGLCVYMYLLQEGVFFFSPISNKLAIIYKRICLYIYRFDSRNSKQ
jgi:hypothetical protein